MVLCFPIACTSIETHYTFGKIGTLQSLLIAVFKYPAYLTSPEVWGGSHEDPVIAVPQVLIRLPSDRCNIGIKLEARGPAEPRHPCAA